MKKDNLIEIGKFQRAHALKGELNAMLDIDPQYVEDGNPLVVDIDGCYVPFYAESIRTKGSTTFLIKLEGVDNSDDAVKFVNKEIFAERHIADNYEEEHDDGVYLTDLIGYDVNIDGFGKLGVVDYIDDSTANPLLYIKKQDGSEIIVPAADDFFTEIDTENKIITLSLPSGILDLNS